MLVSCVFMSFGIVMAQKDASDAEILSESVKIGGNVVDNSVEQNPIEGVTVTIMRSDDEAIFTVTTDKEGNFEKTNLEPGRYFISYAKDGYEERFGKSRFVAAGVEVYDRIILRKKDNIISFFKKYDFVLWPLIIPSVIGLVFFVVVLVFIIVIYRKMS